MHTNEPGFAQRLWLGAKDLIWQEDPMQARRHAMATKPPLQNNKENSPGAATRAACASTPATPATPANPLQQELLSLVLNRPTAFSAFRDAELALLEIVPDEGTRYRSAFALLKKTQQRNLGQMLQALDVHLGLLDAEIARFAGQSRQAEEGEIGQRVQQAQSLQTRAQEMQTEIKRLQEAHVLQVQRLQQEMQQQQEQAAQLLRESEERKAAIVHTSSQFLQASEQVRQDLQDARRKLELYLQ